MAHGKPRVPPKDWGRIKAVNPTGRTMEVIEGELGREAARDAVRASRRGRRLRWDASPQRRTETGYSGVGKDS